MAHVTLCLVLLFASIFLLNCQEVIVEHTETTEPVAESPLEDSSVLQEPTSVVEDSQLTPKVDDPVASATTATTSTNPGNSTLARNESNPINCTPIVRDTDEANRLIVLNGTALLQELTPAVANNKTNSTAGDCVVVAFYSPYCNFCARTAPFVNALPSAFPGLKFYAVDVVQSSQINMRYGLVAVPSILLFHNGRAVAKFNDSLPSIDGLTGFITRHTGITPDRPLAPDASGPMSDVPLEFIDWVLVSAWVFTAVCLIGAFLRSGLCKHMTASVQNAWREAQHQHQD
ncbi:unnamed protein product [Ixodes hexagonus]